MQLDDRQNAAVLAGLRLLQALRENRITTTSAELDVSIDDIETDGGTHDPLTSEEIDSLCESINVVDAQA